jgi:hypothetical protein
MQQQEVALICGLFEMEFEQMRYLLTHTTLDAERGADLRACHRRVAAHHQRLEKLVGPIEADEIMRFIYHRILDRQGCRRNRALCWKKRR